MSYFQPEIIAIILGGAFLAGIINTFAGNGSIITLTLLMEVLGLPADLANGTNRVGVLSNSVSPSYVFYRKGLLQPRRHKVSILCTLIGAVGGVLVSLYISNDAFRQVFRYLLLVFFLLILLKPSRWLTPKNYAKKLPIHFHILLYIVLGFYGGFIQMGMGIFLLAAMVLIDGEDLLRANAAKLLIVGIYTALAVGIFALFGKIHWGIGGLFVVGQMSGAWVAARWAIRFERIHTFIYILLVVVVLASLLKAFDIIPMATLN